MSTDAKYSPCHREAITDLGDFHDYPRFQVWDRTNTHVWVLLPLTNLN